MGKKIPFIQTNLTVTKRLILSLPRTLQDCNKIGVKEFQNSSLHCICIINERIVIIITNLYIYNNNYCYYYYYYIIGEEKRPGKLKRLLVTISENCISNIL